MDAWVLVQAMKDYSKLFLLINFSEFTKDKTVSLPMSASELYCELFLTPVTFCYKSSQY